MILSPEVINAALGNGTRVTVNTSNPNGHQAGNIRVGVMPGGTDGMIEPFSDPNVSLTLNAGAGGGAGSITINSPITDGEATLSLILSAPRGSITVNNSVTIGGSFSATAGTEINLNDAAGPIISTGGGGQTYNGPVVLLAAASLVDTGNGAIHFASTGGRRLRPGRK